MSASVASLAVSTTLKFVEYSVKLTQSRQKNADISKTRNALDRLRTRPDQQIVAALAALTELEASLKPSQVDATSAFLRSSASQSFLNTLLMASLTENLASERAALAQDLRLLLLLEGVEAPLVEEVAASLFSVFEKNVLSAVVELRRVDRAIMPTLQAMAVVESKSHYFEAIAGLRSRLERFTPGLGAAVTRFRTEYSDSIREGFATIAPASSGPRTEVEFSAIHVEPQFEISGDKVDASEMDYLLRKNSRIVILGDPGAGKSTCAQWILQDFINNGENTRPVPVLIRLRAYAEAKKIRSISILDFLTESVNDYLQIAARAEVLEAMLVTGQALVILDGIDELLDLSQRGDIVSAINMFASKYVRCGVIATSRIIGYDERPLSHRFQKVNLRKFDEPQVMDYAIKWFTREENQRDIGKKVALKFFEESGEVADLRANPLMLGLLCNVYRGLRSIPRNRAELYEQCATLMFEKWDSSRGIEHGGAMKSDAKAALRDIALWMYSDSILAEGVRQSQIRRRLIRFWMEKFDDVDQSTDAADDLLDLWKGRAWVLAEVGSLTDSGESVYRFSHQTFLEYFAGVQIARENPDPERLWSRLEPEISVGNWEIIAQIAIQTLEQAYDGAGTQLLTKLCTAVAESDKSASAANLLLFAARNVDSIHANASSVALLARACAEAAMDVVVAKSGPEDWVRGGGFGPYYFYDEEGLDGLKILIQNIGGQSHVVTRAVYSLCHEIIDDPDDRASASAAFLWLTLDSFAKAITGNIMSHDIEPEKKSHVNAVIRERIKQLSAVNVWIPILAVRKALVHLASVIDVLPANSIICAVDPFPSADLSANHTSFGEVLWRQEVGRDVGLPEQYVLTLEDRNLLFQHFAIAFEKSDYTVHAGVMNFTSLEKHMVRRNFNEDAASSWDNDVDYEPSRQVGVAQNADYSEFVIFGALSLLAVYIEFERWLLADQSEDNHAEIDMGRFSSFVQVLTARRVPMLRLASRSTLSESPMSEKFAEVMLKWSFRDRNFIVDGFD